jgi:hypothetical protein
VSTACPHCAAAKVAPDHPRYQAGCGQCGIRSLAQSPLYQEGGLDSGNAAPYRKLLAQVFGTEWRAGHRLVEAEHARIRKSRAFL